MPPPFHFPYANCLNDLPDRLLIELLESHPLDAYENEIPVEGRVTETCKGGFRVEVVKRTAFCPISQMDSKYVETPDDYVGQTYLFVITQFEGNGRNIVISRREILKREQKKIREAFYKDLAVSISLIKSSTVMADIVKGCIVPLDPSAAATRAITMLFGASRILIKSYSPRSEYWTNILAPIASTSLLTSQILLGFDIRVFLPVSVSLVNIT